MARHITIHKTNGNDVAYGLDHDLGWFYQEFDRSGECVVDEDSMFTGLSKGGLLSRLEHTFAPAYHKHRIALDLDPAC